MKTIYVSGNDWWANPSAPWNEPSVCYVRCDECNGDGGQWISEDGIALSQKEYDSLSEEDKDMYEFFECGKCEGLGTIEKYK